MRLHLDIATRDVVWPLVKILNRFSYLFVVNKSISDYALEISVRWRPAQARRAWYSFFDLRFIFFLLFFLPHFFPNSIQTKRPASKLRRRGEKREAAGCETQ
ncbi:Uncharacterized protein APZ42_014074 [Daphnia magna]|uniref:Uncharacterized protein n=1 Tax=Daphnia magna TaxID=35525 RepID=A0A162Q9L4_9CRUS|nr:Uncharacterized protein APZ42_014074 [Daphnia magna]